jgi:hypothetical protein
MIARKHRQGSQEIRGCVTRLTLRAIVSSYVLSRCRFGRPVSSPAPASFLLEASMAQIILFEHINFHGAHKHVFGPEPNLNAQDDSFFNDKVSSLAVLEGNWELYGNWEFDSSSQYPVILGPGLYPNVQRVQIKNDDMSSLQPTNIMPTVSGDRLDSHILLFEHARFHGAHKHVFIAEPNLNARDDNFFNDKASSLVVPEGNWELYGNWEFDSSSQYPVILGPGLYPWVESVQIKNDDMSSLQPTSGRPTILGDHLDNHVILFEHANFHGAHKHVFIAEPNLNADDDNFFNDRISSIVVLSGAWFLFRDSGFKRPYDPVLVTGLYPFVGDIGITNDDISSLTPDPGA